MFSCRFHLQGQSFALEEGIDKSSRNIGTTYQSTLETEDLNSMFHYHLYKGPPLAPLLSQMSLAHALSQYFLTVRTNILPSKICYSIRWPVSVRQSNLAQLVTVLTYNHLAPIYNLGSDTTYFF